MIDAKFVIEEHNKLMKLSKRSSFDSSLISMSNLESAVNSVYQTFNGIDIYKSNEQKCLRMLYVLIKCHAFTDGNKRTAVFVFLYMCEQLTVNFNFSPNQLIKLSRSIADNSMSWDDICSKFDSNEMLEEHMIMNKYSYTGPIYRFDNYFDEVFKPIITSAPSIDKAMSNIIFRLKQKYDLKPGTNLTIDKDRIEEIETPSDDTIKHDYCPECGYMLTDSGECPVCDYGEEDLIEANNTEEVVYSNETDSLGNKLTVGQAQYFSNSKIRDNSGKLLVCHHGSDVTDISIFDTSKPASFFTTDKGYAQDYANKSDTEGKIYDVYLNITNPIDLSTKEQLRFVQEKYLPWAQEHNIRLPKELIMGKNVPFNDLADGLFMFLKEDRSYDGIIVNEGVEYAINKGRYSKSANTSYLPLYSNQIKLITNTNPTKDDNIDEGFYNCINI